jgi:hypothetical protein
MKCYEMIKLSKAFPPQKKENRKCPVSHLCGTGLFLWKPTMEDSLILVNFYISRLKM